jgi:hypothetical protein
MELPLMLAETWFAAGETIFHRTAMIWQGGCSPAEYQRMMLEKWTAAMQSGLAWALPSSLNGASATELLAPWHRGASANARRLRRK